METANQPKQAGMFFERINKFQQEIEEFALQFTLGKAEAADMFQEIRKEFNTKLNEWRNAIHETKDDSAENIKQLFDEMQIQLALGKSEVKEAYLEQRKKIDHLISVLESEIQNQPQLKYLLPEIKLEVIKLKLKLQIIGIDFKLRKNDLSRSIHEELNKLRTNVSYFLKNESDGSHRVKERVDHFNAEIEKAYDHIKKAFKSFSTNH